jgi:hypothetical protein
MGDVEDLGEKMLKIVLNIEIGIVNLIINCVQFRI